VERVSGEEWKKEKLDQNWMAKFTYIHAYIISSIYSNFAQKEPKRNVEKKN